MFSIYLITNSINDKLYVGQTTNTIEFRFAEHKKPSSKGCIKLYNAFNKHGKENFKIELIAITFTQEDANYWEDYFILAYNAINNGYNIKRGGTNGPHNETTKQKISISKLANHEKMSQRAMGAGNPFYDKKHTDKMKRNHSDMFSGNGNPMFGHHHTDAAKKIISDKRKARKTKKRILFDDVLIRIKQEYDAYEIVNGYTYGAIIHLMEKFQITRSTIIRALAIINNNIELTSIS